MFFISGLFFTAVVLISQAILCLFATFVTLKFVSMAIYFVPVFVQLLRDVRLDLTNISLQQLGVVQAVNKQLNPLYAKQTKWKQMMDTSTVLRRSLFQITVFILEDVCKCYITFRQTCYVISNGSGTRDRCNICCKRFVPASSIFRRAFRDRCQN